MSRESSSSSLSTLYCLDNLNKKPSTTYQSILAQYYSTSSKYTYNASLFQSLAFKGTTMLPLQLSQLIEEPLIISNLAAPCEHKSYWAGHQILYTMAEEYLHNVFENTYKIKKEQLALITTDSEQDSFVLTFGTRACVRTIERCASIVLCCCKPTSVSEMFANSTHRCRLDEKDPHNARGIKPYNYPDRCVKKKVLWLSPHDKFLFILYLCYSKQVKDALSDCIFVEDERSPNMRFPLQLLSLITYTYDKPAWFPALAQNEVHEAELFHKVLPFMNLPKLQGAYHSFDLPVDPMNICFTVVTATITLAWCHQFVASHPHIMNTQSLFMLAYYFVSNGLDENSDYDSCMFLSNDKPYMAYVGNAIKRLVTHVRRLYQASYCSSSSLSTDLVESLSISPNDLTALMLRTVHIDYTTSSEYVSDAFTTSHEMLQLVPYTIKQVDIVNYQSMAVEHGEFNTGLLLSTLHSNSQFSSYTHDLFSAALYSNTQTDARLNVYPVEFCPLVMLMVYDIPAWFLLESLHAFTAAVHPGISSRFEHLFRVEPVFEVNHQLERVHTTRLIIQRDLLDLYRSMHLFKYWTNRYVRLQGISLVDWPSGDMRFTNILPLILDTCIVDSSSVDEFCCPRAIWRLMNILNLIFDTLYVNVASITSQQVRDVVKVLTVTRKHKIRISQSMMWLLLVPSLYSCISFKDETHKAAFCTSIHLKCPVVAPASFAKYKNSDNAENPNGVIVHKEVYESTASNPDIEVVTRDFRDKLVQHIDDSNIETTVAIWRACSVHIPITKKQFSCSFQTKPYVEQWRQCRNVCSYRIQPDMGTELDLDLHVSDERKLGIRLMNVYNIVGTLFGLGYDKPVNKPALISMIYARQHSPVVYADDRIHYTLDEILWAESYCHPGDGISSLTRYLASVQLQNTKLRDTFNKKRAAVFNTFRKPHIEKQVAEKKLAQQNAMKAQQAKHYIYTAHPVPVYPNKHQRR